MPSIVLIFVSIINLDYDNCVLLLQYACVTHTILNACSMTSMQIIIIFFYYLFPPVYMYNLQHTSMLLPCMWF